MRIGTCAVVVILGACAAPVPLAEHRQASELTGRIAGAPQRCVPTERQIGLRIAQGDNHLLLYGSGRTVWVNNLGSGCSFASGDILITETLGSSYCRGDLVRSVGALSHMPGNSCILGDFVPYTHP